MTRMTHNALIHSSASELSDQVGLVQHCTSGRPCTSGAGAAAGWVGSKVQTAATTTYYVPNPLLNLKSAL